MLFHAATDTAPALAITQPAHAWLSGRLLRAWASPLPEPLLLTAEQHDIAWQDWERAPSFDAAKGLPTLFRAIGAAEHAPMWALGVERALACWGRHAALLLSRHGGMIYTRFMDRHRVNPADAAAADHYLATQAALQAEWQRGLGLETGALDAQQTLLTLSDQLSLALCGELPTPLEVETPGGPTLTLRATAGAYTLAPWPFAEARLTFEIEARALPESGRFESEAAMRAWHASPARVPHRVTLTRD